MTKIAPIPVLKTNWVNSGKMKRNKIVTPSQIVPVIVAASTASVEERITTTQLVLTDNYGKVAEVSETFQV